jgi:hypothetical protein
MDVVMLLLWFMILMFQIMIKIYGEFQMYILFCFQEKLQTKFQCVILQRIVLSSL